MIVIVPYRPDHGHRDQLWAFLHKHYWASLGFQVVVGEHTDGPFNRSKAVNQAANRNWDYAVIADADTWVPERQLRLAHMTARISGKLVAAFDTVIEIAQPSTLSLLSGQLGFEDTFHTVRARRRPLETQSSMLVVPRTLWDQIGGMDERFTGWGGEDNALWKHAELAAGTSRIPGNAYHMWHPPAADKHHGPTYRSNLNLWNRYQQATTIDELP